MHKEEGKGEEGEASVGKLVKVQFLSRALCALRGGGVWEGYGPRARVCSARPGPRCVHARRAMPPGAGRGPARNKPRLVLTAAARRR